MQKYNIYKIKMKKPKAFIYTSQFLSVQHPNMNISYGGQRRRERQKSKGCRLNVRQPF